MESLVLEIRQIRQQQGEDFETVMHALGAIRNRNEVMFDKLESWLLTLTSRISQIEYRVDHHTHQA